MTKVTVEFHPSIDRLHTAQLQADIAEAARLDALIDGADRACHLHDRDERLWGEDESDGDAGRFLYDRA